MSATRNPKAFVTFFIVLLVLLGGFLGVRSLVVMPGRSPDTLVGAPTVLQQQLAEELKKDVEYIAGEIGSRHAKRPPIMEETVAYIERRLQYVGADLSRETYRYEGAPYHNVVLNVPGTLSPSRIVVVGAHYDSVRLGPVSPDRDCRGADDNASGVAAALALARRYVDDPQPLTLRFVFFANEEEPFFGTDGMGSLVHAREAKERGDDIVAMLSLETLGYYSERPNSQSYPMMLGTFYPDRGNFVAFVANLGSYGLVKRVTRTFRRDGTIPSEGASLPAFIPGVTWSDQWSFWKQGYDAVMVTDTAQYRNPYYHTPDDNPGTLDYERLARVVDGLEAVVDDLASGR